MEKMMMLDVSMQMPPAVKGKMCNGRWEDATQSDVTEGSRTPKLRTKGGKNGPEPDLKDSCRDVDTSQRRLPPVVVSISQILQAGTPPIPRAVIIKSFASHASPS